MPIGRQMNENINKVNDLPGHPRMFTLLKPEYVLGLICLLGFCGFRNSSGLIAGTNPYK